MLAPNIGEFKRVPIHLPDKDKSSVQRVLRCPRLRELNSKLDSGTNELEATKWLVESGYSYTPSEVRDYATYYRRTQVIIVEESYSPMEPIGMKLSPREKLKSEIDALDLLIQKGYDNLKRFQGKPIEPNMILAAIKLKNDLTGGHHGFLTNYGKEYLSDLESKKYNLIIEKLLQYIPENIRELAINEISQLEEQYYYNTEYYEDFLRAKGNLTEEQITNKLLVWEKDRRLLADNV